MVYWMHIGGACMLLLYGILVWCFELQFKRIYANISQAKKFLKRELFFHRLAMLISFFVFLLGGKLGTPFFKGGSFWIYGKVILWIGVSFILIILNGQIIKERLKKIENLEETFLKESSKKRRIFVLLYIIALLLIALLGHFKTF